MRVQRVPTNEPGMASYELRDDDDRPVTLVNDFLAYLGARGCSPNTVAAYAYDLRHFSQFLAARGLGYGAFRPPDALALLAYLRRLPSRRPARRLAPVLTTTEAGVAATCLAPATVNRILAAVSSFYDYLIVAEALGDAENPVLKVEDLAAARVAERRQPFIGRASRQRPVRRFVQVRTVQRLPRPLSDERVRQLLAACRRRRDRAMFLLMLQGGLRPGEVLNLRLGDIEYGRRRVVIRHYTDHPRGARTKSRVERVVDLHEPEALAALSDYVMRERPDDADCPFVFLVGGRGRRRREPLSYAALVKLFARQCDRLGIRDPWVTPHSLRHTHATAMFEGGMRELTLQKRLGHASPESTRLYTRVSDARVVEEYGRALGRGRLE
jgi:integrase